MLHYLFSYHGRISRRWMWFAYVLCAAYMGLLVGLIGLVSYLNGGPNPVDATWHALTSKPVAGWQWLVVLIYWGGLLAWLYPLGAIVVKRLHDRGKGARWLLLFAGLPIAALAFGVAGQTLQILPAGNKNPAILAPVLVCDVLLFWFWLELLFLPGTKGDNRFGPQSKSISGRIDPRAGPA